MKKIAFENQWRRFLHFSTYSLVIFALACGSGGDQSESQGLDDIMEEETETQTSTMMSDDVLAEIIRGIPAPVELVALIKASGAEYSESMLNPTENSESYTTSYRQALNLGIYGADLGYINMYEKTISSLSYLNAVKEMADLIKVGQFFDFVTLKRLSSNKENIDSLLFITTSNFNRMDEYLRDQGRADLSVLSVAGAWLEGIYISCQVSKATGNAELVERIGEQKVALADICLMLNQYGGDENMVKIAADFEKINKVFAAVSMTSTEAQPEMKEVDGKLVVIDNSSSEINLSNETLDKIIAVVTEVRNNCIN
ncbi:MAG TPA: hypothetical protein DCX54_06785 [Flavobacteriales bacterium]|nr:hypothetical protein [Flavobacteriales bacterium]